MAFNINLYSHTYDIPAKKWVKDMTEEELIKYGYKQKQEGSSSSSPVEVASVKASRSKTATSNK